MWYFYGKSSIIREKELNNKRVFFIQDFFSYVDYSNCEVSLWKEFNHKRNGFISKREFFSSEGCFHEQITPIVRYHNGENSIIRERQVNQKRKKFIKGLFSWVAAREASWRRVFDPYAPLLINLYHYLEQNLHFGLVPEDQFWVSQGRY